MKSYPALLGRRGGEVQLHLDRIIFQLDDTDGGAIDSGLGYPRDRQINAPIVITLSNLEIALGGTNSQHFLLTDRLTRSEPIVVQDREFLKSLAESGNPLASKILHDMRQKEGLKWAARSSPFLLVVALLILIPIGFSALPVGWLNGKISHAQERAIGKVILGSLVNTSSEYAPEARTAIAKMAERIREANPELQSIDFQFFVSNASDVNAFALPGGIVVMNRGLIAEAETVEEVAGVLAHEMAHVELRHTLRSLAGRLGYLGGFLLLNLFLSPDAALVIGNSMQIANLKYSRDDEREADERGFKYLVNAEVDPNGMISFFQKLEKKEAALLGDHTGVASKTAKFFSTHPLSGERVERLKSLNSDASASKSATSIRPFEVSLDELRRGF